MNSKTFEQFNQFHHAFIRINQLINDVIEEQNINISREQLGVFKLLMKHKTMTLKDIAEKQGVFKTAITKRVRKLEEKGFIKKINSDDKREKLIELTEEGYQFYESRQKLLYEGMAKKLDISDEEVDELSKYLEEINNIIKIKEAKNE